MRPDQDYTREYPSHMPAKITVRLKDGMVRTRTVQGFPGLPSHPFTWQDAVDTVNSQFERLRSALINFNEKKYPEIAAMSPEAKEKLKKQLKEIAEQYLVTRLSY